MSDSLWVFGYGSLMWRPGFAYEICKQALLKGYHRSLCVFSHVHRGTPKTPGLVLGLDEGGQCNGIAYRVSAENRDKTLEYLRKREQVTNIYLERQVEIWPVGEDSSVTATTYIVDKTHRQYTGKLTTGEQLRYIRQGNGQSGKSTDYVLSAASHLEEIGVEDIELNALARLLKGRP